MLCDSDETNSKLKGEKSYHAQWFQEMQAKVI